MSKHKKELDIVRREKQLLQEEIERLFAPKQVFQRAVNVFLLRPFKRLTNHTYKFLHQYDSNYQNNKFKPYVLKERKNSLDHSTNVMHIINNFKTGGASRIVVDLMEGLPPHYSHAVVTRYNPKPQNYEGVKVHEYCDQLTSKQVKNLLKDVDPHIVHIHWGTMWSREDSTWQWYYSIFRELEQLKIPIIQNINLPVVPYYFNKSDVDYIFVSEYVKDNFGGDRRNNAVIYPGSDLSFFKREGALVFQKNIGMVYRLDDHKLKASSIDPFILAALEDSEVHVHIVGDGELKPIFIKAVEAQKLMDQFTFYSYVPYESLPTIYGKFDMFIAPVFQESFGQVTPFAMSMGLPVLGYNTGALAEIIGDVDCLVEPGDAKGLSELMVNRLNDKDWMESKSKFNVQRSTEFSLNAMIEQYHVLYDSKIKNNTI